MLSYSGQRVPVPGQGWVAQRGCRSQRGHAKGEIAVSREAPSESTRGTEEEGVACVSKGYWTVILGAGSLGEGASGLGRPQDASTLTRLVRREAGREGCQASGPEGPGKATTDCPRDQGPPGEACPEEGAVLWGQARWEGGPVLPDLSILF